MHKIISNYTRADLTAVSFCKEQQDSNSLTFKMVHLWLSLPVSLLRLTVIIRCVLVQLLRLFINIANARTALHQLNCYCHSDIDTIKDSFSRMCFKVYFRTPYIASRSLIISPLGVSLCFLCVCVNGFHSNKW